jgi:tetratricopeptide (TPR) repeat protein
MAHFSLAQSHLGRAFRLDSTYYIAALWWIFARENRGDLAGADSLIRSLERRRGSMSRYEQTLFEYIVADAHGTPDQRYQIDKKLVVFGPASEYRYCLIRDAVEAGRPQDALRESETLDDSYSWMRLMRGIPSFRIRAFAQLRQFDRALATATQAWKDLPGDLSPVYPEIDALAAMGRLDEIERVVAGSASAPGVNDADGGNLMLYAGLRLEAAGRSERARRLFARALASYMSETPSAAGPEVILFGRARALYYLERWDEARGLFDTLAAVPPGTSRYDRKAVSYLGSLAARRGDTAEVSRMRRRLANSAPKSGDTEYFEAQVAALLGQRDRALTWLGTAMELGAKAWDVVNEGDATPSMDPDFAVLRGLTKFQRVVALW